MSATIAMENKPVIGANLNLNVGFYQVDEA